MPDPSSRTVYRPNQRKDLSLRQTWLVMLRHMAASRNLVWQLFKRDFFASYKKSFLGITWIFLSPILGVVAWVFLQRTGLLQPGATDVPYPVYVLLGTTMWQLFVSFYEAGRDTLEAGKDFIMNIKYPHEVLLVKQTAQQLARFTIILVANLAVLAGFGIWPAWEIVFFPLVVLPLFFLGAAIGLVISMVGVATIDVERFMALILSLGMWSLPIIYTDRVDEPLVQGLITWNPLTYLVCSARDVILYGRLYDTTGYLLCAMLSLVIFLVAWRLFFVAEDKLIERMI
jgi:lipopolysaccharide transport system permease protein